MSASHLHADGALGVSPHVTTWSLRHARGVGVNVTNTCLCEIVLNTRRTEGSLMHRTFAWALFAMIAQAIEPLAGYPLQALCVLFGALELPRGRKLRAGAAALNGAGFAAFASALSVVVWVASARAVTGISPSSSVLLDLATEDYLPLIGLSACASGMSAILERHACEQHKHQRASWN